MQEAITKAKALIEALGYIQRFADKIVVVKMGGSVMDDERALRDLLTDGVFMNTVGMRPVIVHGGGKAISSAKPAAATHSQPMLTSAVRDLCISFASECRPEAVYGEVRFVAGDRVMIRPPRNRRGSLPPSERG